MIMRDRQAAFEAFDVLFQDGGLDTTGDLEIVKKSKLALRLALSLESLCVGPWLQEPWTVDSVLIPDDPDKTPTDRLDHVYIRCVLASHHMQAGLLPVPWVSLPENRKVYLLSLAQFLVDIRNGTKGHWPGAGAPLDAWYDALCSEVTSWPSSKAAEVDLWSDYRKAIEGCLLFPRICQAEPQWDPPDGRKLVQEVISKHIVLPLQQHLERWTVDDGGIDFPPQDPGQRASTAPLTDRDSTSEFTLWGEAEDNFKILYVNPLMSYVACI